MNFLAGNIGLIRKIWKENQEKFAERFGLQRFSIGKYETGQSEPTLKFVLELELLTGIPMRRMLTEKIDELDVPSEPLKTPPMNAPSNPETPDPLTGYDKLVKVIKALQSDVQTLKADMKILNADVQMLKANSPVPKNVSGQN